MHIFFSGIGGTAIGPLALIAKQAGHTVSGSDSQPSQYIDYLRKQGVLDIHIGQDRESIAHIHEENPIDWYVRSSAIPNDSPEFLYAQEQKIKTSKRDELLNQILNDTGLKLIAIAGTHGKTTTTAMVIWLFKKLGLPISYSVGAKIGFGDMGHYERGSEYFVYECDEFDRNFLSFRPHLSLITGVSWDHHEIFPTREDYQLAFQEFIEQSNHTVLWREDFDYLGLEHHDRLTILEGSADESELAFLPGFYNRLDAWLAANGLAHLTGKTTSEIAVLIEGFPGLQRRMEEIAPNLYSDYAHTPDKIRGAMSVALEIAETKGQELVVVYEPLTNRRQHYMMHDYQDCFAGVKKVYWLPSYLAREDPDQRIIPPEELISYLADPAVAEARERDESLRKTIQDHLDKGDMVVAMAGGGGNSLDEWIRHEFK